MNRRRCLVALGTGITAWAVPVTLHEERRGWRPEASAATLDLSLLVSDPASAEAIGRAYLRAHPDRSEPGVLLRDAGLTQLRTRSSRTTKSIRRHLELVRSKDFLTRQTILLEGWVLARSEASLCALLAIGRDSVIA